MINFLLLLFFLSFAYFCIVIYIYHRLKSRILSSRYACFVCKWDGMCVCVLWS